MAQTKILKWRLDLPRLAQASQHRGRMVRSEFAAINAKSAPARHLVFDEVAVDAPIPLLSVVQATCDFAKSHGLTRLGLFGTRFTMQAGFYEEIFQRQEIAIVLPGADEGLHPREVCKGLVKLAGAFIRDLPIKTVDLQGR